MADESKIPVQPQVGQPGQPGQPGQQQIQIPVDATHRETVYFNFIQAHLTTDEVFLDVAAFPGPAGGTSEPIVLTHRFIMNYFTAKRLTELLRRAIAQHEQMFGVVELDANRRLRVPPQPPRPPAG